MGAKGARMAKRIVTTAHCRICGAPFHVHRRGAYTLCHKCAKRSGRRGRFKSYIPKPIWRMIHPRGGIANA